MFHQDTCKDTCEDTCSIKIHVKIHVKTHVKTHVPSTKTRHIFWSSKCFSVAMRLDAEGASSAGRLLLQLLLACLHAVPALLTCGPSDAARAMDAVACKACLHSPHVVLLCMPESEDAGQAPSARDIYVTYT